MPTRLDDNPNRIDDHYSENDGRYGTARSLDEQERGAFDDIEKNYDKNADSSQEDSNIQKVRDRESTSSGNWGVNRDSFNQPSDSKRRISFNIGKVGKKKGPMGVVIVLLIAAVLGPMAAMPLLGPLMFFENVTKDLNDMVHARDARGKRMAYNKVANADREQALRACGSIITIRCKFATLSSKQVEKLKFAGIEVTGEDKRFSIRERIVPTTYKFEGRSYTAKEWSRELKTNPRAIQAQRLANNVRYSTVSDKAFMNRVYKRFGITKKAPELKGRTAAERVQALLNKAGTGDIGELRFSEKLKSDGTPELDKDGNKQYTLDGGDSGRTYTEADKKRMEKDIARVKNAKPPSRARGAAIGALSVLGYADLACSIKNMIGGASVAAKVANQEHLVSYVAPIAALVYKIKAGDASPEDAEVVGKFFNDTDAQRQISSLEKSNFESAGDKGQVAIKGDVAQVDNPNYGKSALNSDLYNMSTNGGIAPKTESMNLLSLGFGASSLAAGLSSAASVMSKILTVSGCGFVQNWIVRSIGIAATAVIAVGSGGASAAAQVATMVGMMIIFMKVQSVLNSAAEGNPVENADLENNTVARGDAAWTGLSGMMSAGAQANGMIPGTAEDIVAYQSEQQETLLAYDQVDRANVKDQFAITNEYSAMGSFARTLVSIAPKSSSMASLSSSLLSFPLTSFSLLTRSQSVHAEPVDTSRFQQCDDEQYKKMGIGADIQCNVRFFMPEDDLQLDTDEVAKYMEDNNLVNAETGLPEGYTIPEPEASQDGALNAIKGITSGFIPKPPKDYPNDYARFLDYCVYRAMPFGETYEEKSADQDWMTGKKCMTKGAPFSYYRIYTMDKVVNDSEDSDASQSNSSDDTPSTPQVSPTVASGNKDPRCDLSKMPANAEASGACWALKNNTDYSSIPCAAGSTDNGVKNNPANGVTVRACLVKGKPVASVISQNVVSLVTDAQKDGVNITLSSGLRSYSEQVRLYAQNCNSAGSCNPPTAKPGTSNHEKGTAVDWGLNGASFCYKRSTCGAGENAGYDWFQKNAAKYGFFKLSTEAWHWSTNAQ